MEKEKHLDGVLTEQDLVRAWVSMLKETKATYAEVDLDELTYQLKPKPLAQRDLPNGIKTMKAWYWKVCGPSP